MSDIKPVVVYGASGYTGRLVCEYLRHYQIPFIAAGRSAERLRSIIENVPGIETADYEVMQVEHTVEALTELFTGARLVCNTVGPFEYYGETVVEAALKAGCHYTDTTGEPGYIKDIIEKFAAAYQAAGLVLCPANAYMYAPVDICARICIEQGDIDTLEATTSATFIPTYASTQSIFALFKTDAQYLQNKQLLSWPPGKAYEVNVAGHGISQLSHPWGGGILPLWLQDHAQVHTVRQLTSSTDRTLLENVTAMQQHFEENIKSLPYEEQQVALEEIAAGIQPDEPPRENPLIHRTVDQVVGAGSASRCKVVLQSTVPYLQTGFFQAVMANKLLSDGFSVAGFCSPAEVSGHEYILGQMKQFFPVSVTITED